MRAASEGGRAAAYRRILIDELKPWIDARLRTRPDAASPASAARRSADWSRSTRPHPSRRVRTGRRALALAVVGSPVRPRSRRVPAGTASPCRCGSTPAPTKGRAWCGSHPHPEEHLCCATAGVSAATCTIARSKAGSTRRATGGPRRADAARAVPALFPLQARPPPDPTTVARYDTAHGAHGRASGCSAKNASSSRCTSSLRRARGATVRRFLGLVDADPQQLQRPGEGQAGRRQLQLLAVAQDAAVALVLVRRDHVLEFVVPRAAVRADVGGDLHRARPRTSRCRRAR